jgi:hypothetical protein
MVGGFTRNPQLGRGSRWSVQVGVIFSQVDRGMISLSAARAQIPSYSKTTLEEILLRTFSMGMTQFNSILRYS